MSESTSLLKFQIGPVQDFIAQARSTRDLWSGSYLLSWLVAAGIRKLADTPGTELIFPNREGQPLLENKGTFVSANQQKLLTPNIPNLFVARVLGDDAIEVAAAVKEAIEGEWKEIAKSVWNEGLKLGLEEKYEARFNAQVDRHLSITWMLTPVTDNSHYFNDFGNNGWHLDAVRQTRDFDAWPSGSHSVCNEKDALSGKEEAVAGGKDFAAEVGLRFKHLFKHDDHLGAANLIKRVWHLTYLQDVLKLKIQEFKIRSTRAIAARDDRNDDDENTDKSGAEKYLAAIAFDGDSIGAWISGDKLADQSELKKHHTKFSKSLSHFALESAREIVEKDVAGSDKDHKVIQVPMGFLIYAGGDDVVALVPADGAIECARQLRESFVAAIKGTKPDKEGKKPDASAGIAIAHFKSPLQDLVREARKSEKRAKNEVGRPAFSVTLMKRSGEISQWGAKWDCGGIELYDAIANAMGEGDLRSKFPHRVCQLLAPYVTKQTGLIQMNDADGFNAVEVIRREFVHAAERQGSKAIAEALQGPLLDYLGSLGTDPQTQLTAIIGLCTTVAFAHRNRSAETQSAERQPVA